MSIINRKDEMIANLDEPSTTNASPSMGNLSTWCAWGHVGKQYFAIALNKKNTCSGMLGQIKMVDIQELVKGGMIGIRGHVDHIYGLTPYPVFIGNRRGCSHGTKTLGQEV
jgi:hypothetical protein